MSKKTESKSSDTFNFFNSKWSYVAVFFVILLITTIYYLPNLSQKTLLAHDTVQGVSVSSQLVKHYNQTGEYANWAPNIFSGMPSFQIWKSYHNISSWIFDNILSMENTYVIIGLIVALSTAFLFFVIGVHPLIGIVGGIGIALGSFTIISLYAGHNNKVLVMSLVPLTLAGIWLLFERKKYLWALFIIALSMSFQIRLNHIQITYFMAFLVGIWAVFKLVETIKAKDYRHILLSFIVLVVGIGLGAVSNATQLLTTLEYSKETQRGGPSEVEIAKDTTQIQSAGVAYDYATNWSYGKLETFTLLIPNFSGGPEVIKNVDENNEVAKALIQNGVPANNAMQLAEQLPTYWGDQPFVAGTTYISAILIYLMFLGFFIIRDKKKWWLITAFFVTLFIAWGDNFSLFYKLLFEHLPYFNKFRTPSMIFYLTTIIVALTAALTLQQLIIDSKNRETLWNTFFKVSIGFVVFMLVLTLLGPSLFSFVSPNGDESLKAQLLQMTQNNSALVDAIYGGLLSERKSMMRVDAFRSTVLIALTASLIAIYLKRKVAIEVVLGAILILTTVDIVGVDLRYVNHDSFQDNTSAYSENGVVPTEADKLILEDKGNYRVLDISVSTFNEAKTSYFHQSIGGYSPVKLKRYQDLISYQIQQNIQQLSSGNLAGAHVLNMLNTKYIITSPEAKGVFKNEYAYGSAWLVNEVKVMNGSVAVFDNLMSEDLSKVALLEKPSENIQWDTQFSIDSTASIQLEKADNDLMTYKYHSTAPAYAVFSEIYYNSGKGWIAYIDDKKVEQDQVDYLLRGLYVPAGNHNIVFKFDTPTLQLSKKLDMAGSIVIVLLGVGVLLLNVFVSKRQS